jgi:hypothetical protein
MSLTVKNIGIKQEADTVYGNTNVPFQYGEVGTVRVVFEGKEYVFAPNQSITFADDGIGTAVAAIDARLRVVDERDGGPNLYYANPSLPITKW